jgi:tetratricopeptide (TPR) repeat protein
MPEPAEGSSREPRDGQIVTFYSFKGGTGRTMALANVAWILAASGRRVLVADWDLESPGLHRFFHPFMETEVRDAPGIIDLIRDYERAAIRNGRTQEADRAEGRAEGRAESGAEGRAESGAESGAEGRTPRAAELLIGERARVEQYAFSLNWEFTGGGSLDFLSSGRQNDLYAATLGALDWESFYNRLNGGEFLDALRADMKRHYDYVLIDSRTGLSDVADICTVHLPDVLVDCFTLSTQGIEGAAQVARSVQELYHGKRPIRILPVPMRVDPFEKEKVDAGHAVAVRLFDGLPAAMTEPERQAYWSEVQVPYRPFYAYEETLAVFGDAPGAPTSLLSSFERITGHITKGAVTRLAPMEESLRQRTMVLFTRQVPAATDEILLDCAPEDQVWAEWIGGVLGAAGLVVRDGAEEAAGPAASHVLAVVSSAYAAHAGRSPARTGRQLAVYVAGARPLPDLAAAPSAYLTGLPESDAVEQLYRLLGIARRPPSGVVRSSGVRYPVSEPRISELLARNNRFTGREDDLRRLREELRARSTGDNRPVVLQGLGGVGKTQVALEYVHRFKTDYDLVWWMSSEQSQFVDASLSDLGTRMNEILGTPFSPTAAAAEVAQQVMRALGRGEPVDRWLLIFDNAEDIEDIEPLLPGGNGHVLITSRNRAWGERARLLPVDVFDRAESVEYLRDRAESITMEDADQVADVLGDLPLAVATAGAWLAETGASVPDYLLRLEHHGPRTLSLSPLDELVYPAPVARAWDLSLERLKERSPAAARLFELCSVMAPDINLDLLHSQAMAAVLVPFDSALSEPMVIGRYIQEISRLALAKIDPNAKVVQVHRLVQAVVADRMSEEERTGAQRDVHEMLAAMAPRRDVDDPATWVRYRMLWPHLTPSNAMASEQEPVRQLLIDRVRYLWQRGDHQRGRELALSVESVWEETLSRVSDPVVAASLRTQLLHLRFNRANILRDQARFEESRRLDNDVLEEQRRHLGPEHPHTLMTASALAADTRAIGDYFAALEMDEQNYAKWTELFGETYPRTLAAANNLAVSYRLTGDFAGSLRLDEETFERRRATVGARHPQTLYSAINIGRDLLEAGRYKEAAQRMGAVRELCVQVLGVDSSTTLNAQSLLGMALRSAGEPEQAEPHFREAWDGLIQRFGDDSSDSLACRLSRSANLLALDRVTEAETEIRAVLAVYEQRLGATHPHTLVCRVNLASALRLRTQHAPAFTEARSAVDGLTERLGGNHPYTLAAMMVLGTILADDGRLEEAHELEQQAWDRLALTLGRAHPDALRCRANLLLTEQEQGVEGAADERKAVVEELARLLGAGHPNAVTLMAGRRLLRALDPQPF